jgi:hypothetical protein
MNAKNLFHLVTALGVGGTLGAAGGAVGLSTFGAQARLDCLMQGLGTVATCDNAAHVWGLIGMLPGILLMGGAWVHKQLKGSE